MAAARQILELLRSHAVGDEERFRTAALQLAANEARQGHHDLAKEIEGLLENTPRHSLIDSGTGQTTNSIPFFRPQGELAGLLDLIRPTFGLNKLVLSTDLNRRLRRILKEQQHFGELRENGLRARQKLLLLGPPGCGKTVTAHGLAYDLGLSLFVVRLDAMFTKFLGETATKLRQIFDTVEQHRAVFLFDEFDSVGLARGAQHDVAEMRRVLNSFLVFIDNMKGHSLVIAASNHPEALDPALFRRFDDIIEYSLPTRDELLKLFSDRLSGEKCVKVDWNKVLDRADQLSFAEAVRVADDALKERLIERKPCITTDLLLGAMKERRKGKRHSTAKRK